jgi:hypothetical protein
LWLVYPYEKTPCMMTAVIKKTPPVSIPRQSRGL